jgi:hypothetical protein
MIGAVATGPERAMARGPDRCRDLLLVVLGHLVAGHVVL